AHLSRREPVAGADGPDRDATFFQNVQGEADRQGRLLGKGGGAGPLADGEAVGQGDQAVEVVEVGVGQENLVHAADGPVPEEGGGAGGGGGGPGGGRGGGKAGCGRRPFPGRGGRGGRPQKTCSAARRGGGGPSSTGGRRTAGGGGGGGPTASTFEG